MPLIKFFLLSAVIVLSAVGVQAQNDSVSNPNRGTIRIKRPDKNAYCKVQADYFVYTKQNDAPKTGKLKNGLIYFKRDNKMKNEGEPGNPRPIFSGASFINSDKLKTDGPVTFDSATSFPNNEPDYSEYFTDTVHYSYDYNSDKYDTIQLRVSVNKKGKYTYSYGTKQDSLNIVGQKCMEAMTTVKYWYPAYVTKVKHRRFGQGSYRKKNAYAEIILTIVVSSNSFENPKNES